MAPLCQPFFPIHSPDSSSSNPSVQPVNTTRHPNPPPWLHQLNPSPQPIAPAPSPQFRHPSSIIPTHCPSSITPAPLPQLHRPSSITPVPSPQPITPAPSPQPITPAPSPQIHHPSSITSVPSPQPHYTSPSPHLALPTPSRAHAVAAHCQHFTPCSFHFQGTSIPLVRPKKKNQNVTSRRRFN